MDRHNGLDRGARMSFEILPHSIGAHVECQRVDVNKMRNGSNLNDSFNGGNESVRHRNYDIALTDARCHQRESQGVRAAVHTDAVRRVAKLRELALKPFDY